MNRNPVELTKNTYDLLIIGAGIYGACVAWEAILRGLSVALVEKADFGSATSANSLKTIHGGLRYLQHADLQRMRESIHERKALMRIAPHLIHPMPVLVPTYGHGMKGKEVLCLALKLNDLISSDRNQIDDPQKHIPNGRIISKQECEQLLPGIPNEGLTGGAVFYDAQVYNSERLTLSFIRSAEQAGADVANYVEVTGFLRDGDRITGIEAQDVLSGDRFDIRAKTVVNTSGPWMNQMLGWLNGLSPHPKVPLAKAVNLVTRPLFQSYAVGISSANGYRDLDAMLNKGSRFLFIAPWRGKSMIGTSYSVWDKDPEELQVTEDDIQDLLDQINQAYPPANLTREDVDFVHGGLLPRTGVDQQTGEPLLAKHHQIRDYSQEGLPGLLSVLGVKYTTARDVAQKAVDQVFKSWGQKPPKSTSAVTPLYGGTIERFEEFLQNAIAKSPDGLNEEVMRRLVYNYGSAYPEVLKYLDENLKESNEPINDLAVLKAEVIYAVREEMAQKLSDVVLRRTELGTAGLPGNEVLKICAETMGAEVGWSSAKVEQELQEVSNFNQNKPLVAV
ncbi:MULTISPECIES: glycerol-3-phosphate dehydrogenase/oxidase [unclassified Coleofasciculus]|uniref:glycerol-3-phosphate dehydrogenase/oxidase n=1 Tax=unclassified Coleofasciculus TaxID=2692782 RepID=UPI001880420F|nr:MULTISPECIES: glycerol-3-phosphate dehydrogenase/oxidase [unclassified Coleofasciculus]MBE9126152.1 glycerol-3-phosphate dehydrogenase/oxidase [Coleofasciculus sp. LEGE 07081]MBE9149570.1 glycerol-3-phosphate dehydrogenase/oxidase [Coleofasciculus sp. LEGE 07092]